MNFLFLVDLCEDSLLVVDLWAMVWELVGQMGWMTLPPLSEIWFAFAEMFEQTAFDAFAMMQEHLA